MLKTLKIMKRLESELLIQDLQKLTENVTKNIDEYDVSKFNAYEKKYRFLQEQLKQVTRSVLRIEKTQQGKK